MMFFPADQMSLKLHDQSTMIQRLFSHKVCNSNYRCFVPFGSSLYSYMCFLTNSEHDKGTEFCRQASFFNDLFQDMSE